MAKAQFGTLNEFNASAEAITAYLERVELLFLRKLRTTRQESSQFSERIVGPMQCLLYSP